MLFGSFWKFLVIYSYQSLCVTIAKYGVHGLGTQKYTGCNKPLGASCEDTSRLFKVCR